MLATPRSALADAKPVPTPDRTMGKVLLPPRNVHIERAVNVAAGDVGVPATSKDCAVFGEAQISITHELRLP